MHDIALCRNPMENVAVGLSLVGHRCHSIFNVFNMLNVIVHLGFSQSSTILIEFPYEFTVLFSSSSLNKRSYK